MKEQLTLQELSAYLPWEVEFSSWTLKYKNGIGYNSTKVTKLVTIDTTNTWINGNPCIESRDIKLILYPLSHLTKEIEHKGEKFVPMERLCNINLGTEWSKTNYTEIGSTNTEWWVCLKDKPSWYFGYNIEDEFYLVDKDGFHKFLKKSNVLYQKLAEWQVDFQNLIPRGLAVDKTTL